MLQLAIFGRILYAKEAFLSLINTKIMSKKNKNKYQPKVVESQDMTTPSPTRVTAADGVYAMHEKEYQLVRTDLLRVLIVNILFLAGVLAIFFVNKSNPFLQAWYDKVL